MEERMSSALKKAREMEQDRDSLTQQLAEATEKTEDVKPGVSSEQTKEQEELKQTVTSLRASLEVSQQEVLKQGEVIASLSCDLSHAHARLSDLTGELSEQQKMELETHKALVVDQRMRLSVLTQRLTTTVERLEQKEEELKTLREELVQTEASVQKERSEGRKSISPLTVPHTKDVAIMVSPSQLTNQASKCKGCRQEEIRRQGEETLNAMKERISAVEQKWPCKVLSQQREPIQINQMKQVPMKSHRLKKPAAQRDSISSSERNKLVCFTQSGFAFPEALSEAALERTARLDLSDALELSERTYVDLARALCEALELSEGQLSGCVPLKHQPPAEREHVASLRQEDLELLRSRIALQSSQSQNKDLLLQESQSEIQKLRESQAFGQQLQTELDDVRSQLATSQLESSSLRQTLEEKQSELQHCINHRKNTEGRSKRIGHHNCIPDYNFGKVAVMKKSRKLERKQRADSDKESMISKEGESCKIAALKANVAQQQQSTKLTEAH